MVLKYTRAVVACASAIVAFVDDWLSKHDV
jgi:hypothetical protein